MRTRDPDLTAVRPGRRSDGAGSRTVPPSGPLRPARRALALAVAAALAGCAPADDASGDGSPPSQNEPDHTLTADQTHDRWSRTIEPVLRVEPGAVVEAFTREASAGQLTPESTAEDVAGLDFDPIHPLTGPVYVEGAEPGDLLAVTLHRVELGDWGWSAVVPNFGFLADEFEGPYLKTYRFEEGDSTARFSDRIEVPLRPFPGVVGVAPDTDSLLSTVPPRRNGGNMDDRDLVEGSTVYLPVLAEGALLSVGDGHAAQGDGEVSGTAIEAPLRIVYEVELLEDPGFELPSPQYVNERGYFVTGFAETIDEAARNATRAAVDYLVRRQGLERTEAYVLASTAGNLKVAEAVDVPHMLVTMHLPREVLPEPPALAAGNRDGGAPAGDAAEGDADASGDGTEGRY